MEPHASLFVDTLDQCSQLRAKHTFQRKAFRGHDVNLEAACHQGSGDLQSDEAATDDNRRVSSFHVADDGAAIRQRPQISDPLAALDLEPNGCCTGGDEEGAVITRASVAEL